MATINESLRDESIAHSVWLSRYATEVANRMVKLLNETDADLSARLLDALDRLPPESFTVSRLESLLGSVRELNHQAVASMQAGLESELVALAKNEASYQLSLFDSLLPSQVLSHYPLQGITADTVTRMKAGEYLIEGCMGMNSDAAWGGIDGGFDIPKDRNGQALIWLDYEVNADGSVLVKTFHREYPSAPIFARNSREGFVDGEPADIPADQFVSVRVEMPQNSIWNQRAAMAEVSDSSSD